MGEHTMQKSRRTGNKPKTIRVPLVLLQQGLHAAQVLLQLSDLAHHVTPLLPPLKPAT